MTLESQTPTTVLAHLVGGQAVIGRLYYTDGEHDSILYQPHEVFVIPDAEGRVSITLSPYGSAFGALPPAESIDISRALMSLVTWLSEDLVSAFSSALLIKS